MTPYAELLGRLVRARRFGVVLGLSRMRELLERIGRPDLRLGTVVHVAGTNGKGSTVAMIASLARASGLRVASYTSPHLSCVRERITIDGEMISEAAFVDAATRIEAAGGGELTFFEQLTAIAMLAIAEAGVDVTVLEVGLGGRLDATNVVDAAVGLVTGVAIDHEAVLGPTLDAIAREKAGIFKRGQRAVIGASGEAAAVPWLIEAARSVCQDVTVVDAAAVDAVPAVGLFGEHQRCNAAAALAALDALDALGVGVTFDPAVRAAALAVVRHPGRFEEVGDVIIDGAHNPHAAAALARAVHARGIEPVLVLAVSADKDARQIVRALVPVVRAVIATRYRQDRSLGPEPLAAIVREAGGVPVDHAPDLTAALAAAHTLGGPVLIAGSLFLAGEARVALLGASADPVALSDPPAAPSS